MSQGGDPIHLKRRSGRLPDEDEQQVIYEKRATTGQHQLSSTSDEDDYYDEPPRRNTSVVRYSTGPQGSNLPSPRPPTTTVPARRTQGTQDFVGAGRPPQTRNTMGRNTTSSYQKPRNTTGSYGVKPQANPSIRNTHWLLPLGIGMIAMLLLFVVGSLIVTWGGQLHDNLVYGTPRTYQTDAVVGHGGDSVTHPSHFIAINYRSQAVVVEWAAGNPAKSVDYVVPYVILGDNSSLTPVTVSFRDVNGDRKADMIIDIHMKNQNQTIVFINDGTKFRPSTATDKIQL